MKEQEPDSGAHGARQDRLPYAPPELVAYNQSAVTLGGVNLRPGFDFIGGGTTSYKAS